MPSESVHSYLASMGDKHQLAFYRERRFIPIEDWNRMASHGVRSSVFSRHNPTLDMLLMRRTAVVLGEPGSGKSTVADAAVLASLRQGRVPILARLGRYEGVLAQTFDLQPPEGSDETNRIYILDGFDEVASRHHDSLVRELAAVVAGNPTARFLLTSRQAYFAALKRQWPFGWPIFYVADLDDSDVEAFAEHNGVSAVAFSNALVAARLEQESTNPFNLNALLTYFKRNNGLPPFRSTAVRFLVDTILGERAETGGTGVRRGLRMLALAMEVRGQNHLSEEQCLQVLQRARGITPGAAAALLSELTQSILVRIGDRYSFQMRSFGEYLAAEDLSEIREPDRALSLMSVPGSLLLSPSWANCAAYLVEMHSGFAAAIVGRAPEWALAASPNAFRERLRTRIVQRVLKDLNAAGVYLHRHPAVRAHLLARLLTSEAVTSLRNDAEGSEHIPAANALLILGLTGDKWAAKRALSIAIAIDQVAATRESALEALEGSGDAASVGPLLQFPTSDPLAEARLEAAAAVMGPDDVGRVLKASDDLGRTVVVNIYNRMESFRSADEVERVLRSITADYDAAPTFGYVRTLWRDAVRWWRPDWAPMAVELLSRLTHSDTEDASMIADGLEQLARGRSSIGSELLKRFSADPDLASRLPSPVFRLINVEDIGDLGHELDPELKVYLRAFGSAELRASMGPASRVPEDDAAVAAIQKQEQEAATRLERLVTAVDNATDEAGLLSSLFDLSFERWPDLRSSQLELLADAVERRLIELDLERSVQWITENRWTMPRALPALLKVLDRYELRMGTDTPLVWALTAQEVSPVTRYNRRIGLSSSAWKLIIQLLRLPATVDQALDGLLRFIASSGSEDADLVDALTALASGERSKTVRRLAVNALVELPAPDVILVRLLASLTDDLFDTVEYALLQRGNRATAERKLRRLLDSPETLELGEVQRPHSSPLDWIGWIRSPEVWTTLVTLRKLALKRALPIVTGRFTDVLASIDELRLADVIEAQVRFAPEGWRAYELHSAARHRRDGSIKATQQAPFDEVLRRMSQSTTLNRFKIWVEGPSDAPVVRELVRKYAVNCEGAIATQAIGGWDNFLSVDWDPEGLGHGCSDFIVLFDGDRAKHFSKPGRPLRDDVRLALKKLDSAGCDYRILNCYAIENYFPRAAFESVLGTQPDDLFPLDCGKSVKDQVPRYSKKIHNRRLAEATDVTALAGTDLDAFFREVVDRACPR